MRINKLQNYKQEPIKRKWRGKNLQRESAELWDLVIVTLEGEKRPIESINFFDPIALLTTITSNR